MGFYYGSTRRPLASDDIGPIITPREYIGLLSGATRMVISATPQGSDTCRSRVAAAVAISTLIKGLRRRLQHRPEDSTTHRMLAIAELHAGNYETALRHLAIAVNMLLAPTTSECLRQSLSARVELALLLPLLMRLCLRLGRRATARRLVSALLLRVAGG
jgi:hypothetical protein